MNLTIKRITSLFLALVVSASIVAGKGNDLLKSTPVGSWQLRESIQTDDEGVETIMEIRTSMVGEEERDGVAYVWVETEVIPFHSEDGKKGEAHSETMLLKMLIEKDVFSGEPEEVFNNLRGLGKEIIMKQGDADPVKIEEGGMFGGLILKMLGLEVDYDLTEVGKEKVDTAKGQLKCRVVEGPGTATMKVFFQTIVVESEMKQWTSEKVPFGIVKSESATTMDGDTTKEVSVLIDYGMSGAVSKIDGQVESVDDPINEGLKGLRGLFGG